MSRDPTLSRFQQKFLKHLGRRAKLAETEMRLSGPMVAKILAGRHDVSISVEPYWFASNLKETRGKGRFVCFLFQFGFQKCPALETPGRQAFRHPSQPDIIYLFNSGTDAFVTNELDAAYLDPRDAGVIHHGITNLQEIFKKKTLCQCRLETMENFYPIERNRDWICFGYAETRTRHFQTWLTPDELAVLDLFEGLTLTLTGPALIPILARILRTKTPYVKPIWCIPELPSAGQNALIIHRLKTHGCLLITGGGYERAYYHSASSQRIMLMTSEQIETLAPYHQAYFTLEADKETVFTHQAATFASSLTTLTLTLNGPSYDSILQTIRDFLAPKDNVETGWSFTVGGRPISLAQILDRPPPAAASSPKLQLIEALIEQSDSITVPLPLLEHLSQICGLAQTRLPEPEYHKVRQRLFELAMVQLKVIALPAARITAAEQIMKWYE